MRGIEEIRDINEDPGAHYAAREPQYGRHFEGTDVNRSFESNMRDKQQRERLAKSGRFTGHEEALAVSALLDSLLVPERSKRAPKLDDLFFTALLLGVIADAKKKTKPLDHQERIHSAIDAEPPFLKFWAKLNKRLAETGYEEAGYAQAKEAFNGGKTPLGAMTFIGKQWDGLRAVPAEPVKFLGGVRPAYHGEYRVVDDNGTRWIKVTDKHDQPIAYQIPEAAITAAENTRKVDQNDQRHG